METLLEKGGRGRMKVEGSFGHREIQKQSKKTANTWD